MADLAETAVLNITAKDDQFLTEIRRSQEQMKALALSADTGGRSFQKFNQANTEAAKAAGRFSQNAVNISNQISDFAVQVGGGTSALKAFSQQIPQVATFLGAKFAIGAVFAGLASQLPELVRYMRDFNSATADLAGNAANVEESFKNWEDALSSLQTTVRVFDAKSFAENFNKVPEALRQGFIEAAKIKEVITQTNAQKAIRDLGDAGKDLFGLGLFEGAGQRGSQLTAELGKIAEAFNIPIEKAGELKRVYQDAIKGIASGENLSNVIPLLSAPQTEEAEKFAALIIKAHKTIIDQANLTGTAYQDMMRQIQEATLKHTDVIVPELGKIKKELTALEQVQKDFDDFQQSRIKARETFSILEETLNNPNANLNLQERVFLLDKEIELNKVLKDSTVDVNALFERNVLETQRLGKELETVNAEIQKLGQPKTDDEILKTEILLRQKEGIQKLLDELKFVENTAKATKDALKTDTTTPTLFDQIILDARAAQDEMLALPGVIKGINDELAKLKPGELDSPFAKSLFDTRDRLNAELNRDNPTFQFLQGFSQNTVGSITSTFTGLIDTFGRTRVSFGDMIDGMISDLTKFVTSFFVQKAFEALLQIGLSFIPGAGAATGIVNTGNLNTILNNSFPRGIGADAPGGTVEGETTYLRSNTIIPLRRGGMNGNGEVTVNVFNNGDTSIRTNTREDDRQNRIIDIYVENKVKDQFANGRMDGIMKNRFGLRRTPG